MFRKKEFKIKVLAHGEGLELPKYAKPGDSGMDLRCALEEGQRWAIRPGEALAIPTGISAESPVGYEIQVRSRSGLALNHSIVVANSPGTVDSGYRGEIKVILINHGNRDFIVNRGDKIAQMVVAKVEQVKFKPVYELSQSERGEGGFGSTGIFKNEQN